MRNQQHRRAPALTKPQQEPNQINVPVLLIPDVPADTAPHAITMMARGTGAPTCTMIHFAGLYMTIIYDQCVLTNRVLQKFLPKTESQQALQMHTSYLPTLLSMARALAWREHKYDKAVTEGE